jgi:aromatic ring-cleaving dioxygenase
MVTASHPAPLSRITSYHAHVYYEPATTRPLAERLREQIGERFSVQLGRWHDVHVGPHTRAMYQVAFAVDTFAAFVPWLMLNRQGLSVLVHPNTGRPRDDHLVHGLWLGPALAIKGEALGELDDGPNPISPVVPNTRPTQSP